MRSGLLIGAMFSIVTAFAGEHMTVAVCNVGELPAQAIERAEAEAAYVFQSMNVEVRWTGCGAEVGAADARTRPDYIVRVRVGGHFPRAADISLEAMGRAFINDDGAGNMADVHYGAIREVTNSLSRSRERAIDGLHNVPRVGALIDRRAGHRPNGLMRSAFSKRS